MPPAVVTLAYVLVGILIPAASAKYRKRKEAGRHDQP
jgi:hypothetical protein